jgi:uncharacterized protein
MEAFFLFENEIVDRSLFCIFHQAQCAPPRGWILYVHPFAEEMNKARRMAAQQARALSQAGFSVLLLDLHGCGDSSGEVEDTTWKIWVNDVMRGCQWLREQRRNHAPNCAQHAIWLWGLRAGCLLAAEAAQQMQEACNFIFWQPPSAGHILLQQFMRLKVAHDLLGQRTAITIDNLYRQLSAGQSISIAGYQLPPGLAFGMEAANLTPPNQYTCASRMEIFEISTFENPTMSRSLENIRLQWQQSNITVRSHLITGAKFWQSSEIEELPALINATVSALMS